MDLREFQVSVQAHEDLEILGTRNSRAEDPLVYVRGISPIRPPRQRAVYEIPVSAISEHRWPELAAVFTGQRLARVMTQISRVVGYYSFLHAWNGSKRAELKDRHKGNYAVPEPRRKEEAA